MKSKKQQYELFESIKSELRKHPGKVLVDLAEDANVSLSTLYFWMDGTTSSPRLGTLVRVAGALGLDIVLAKRGAKK